MELAEAQRETVQLFRRTEDPVLTTSDVAEEFGITSEAARQRLDRLVDRGLVEKRTVGAAAVVYWLSDD